LREKQMLLASDGTLYAAIRVSEKYVWSSCNADGRLWQGQVFRWYDVNEERLDT